MNGPPQLISALRKQFDYTPTSGQDELIQKLANYLYEKENDSIFVVTGYAGTGKTTLVSALVKVLPQFQIGSVLLAPTGRAAKVFAAYSGKAAHTIHRCIYRVYTPADGSMLMRAARNPHRNTLFIVDEASLIGNSTTGDGELFNPVRLLEDLVSYVKSGEACRLILIGDKAQLPPVGLNESPALDLAYLKATFQVNIYTAELTEVVRQAETSDILANATALRQCIAKASIKPPFFKIGDTRDVIPVLGADLEDALHSAYSHGIEEALIICRSNKRANLFNKEIRNRILGHEGEINGGDLIMAVKNNYYWLPEDSKAGFIANGDVFEVLRVRKISEIYGFRFADVNVRMIDYPEEQELDVKVILDSLDAEGPSLTRKEMLRLYDEIQQDFMDIPSRTERNKKIRSHPCFNALQIKYAYALTCHKSQGGQWKNVIVEQGWLTDEMLNTEYLKWLYTAITRAKEKLYLLNFSDRFFY